MTAPLCRYCGRPIAKKTETIYFGKDASRGYATHAAKPANRAEVERLVNGIVLSIAFHHDPKEHWVFRANTWDGETYVDPAFDTERCAAAFGRMMAREHPNVVTRAFNEAAATRKEGRNG